MDVEKALLNTINILIESAVSTTTKIYIGVLQSISGDSATMLINGRTNTVQVYGTTGIVGKAYRVFVPNSDMSQAFIITGGTSLPPVTSEDDGKILKVVNGVWTAVSQG